MENIYKHKGNVRTALDKVTGSDLIKTAGSFEYGLKILMEVTEQLIQEKLDAYVKEHPGAVKADLVITIENDWISLWEEGPMRMIRRVVITNSEEEDKPKKQRPIAPRPFD